MDDPDRGAGPASGPDPGSWDLVRLGAAFPLHIWRTQDRSLFGFGSEENKKLIGGRRAEASKGAGNARNSIPAAAVKMLIR